MVVAAMLSGARSQWAEIMRIAAGRLNDPAQDASWPGQWGSSRSGGAP